MARKIPIGPGPILELLKVVRKLHVQVERRFDQVESMLQKAANEAKGKGKGKGKKPTAA